MLFFPPRNLPNFPQHLWRPLAYICLRKAQNLSALQLPDLLLMQLQAWTTNLSPKCHQCTVGQTATARSKPPAADTANVFTTITSREVKNTNTVKLFYQQNWILTHHLIRIQEPQGEKTCRAIIYHLDVQNIFSGQRFLRDYSRAEENKLISFLSKIPLLNFFPVPLFPLSMNVSPQGLIWSALN